MANTHSKSFFGTKTGIILQSTSKNDPYIFFQCIKQKSDGIWEKPSQSEGKIIKCSLEEMIMMAKVLTQELSSWSTVHSYNNNDTPISLNWTEEKNGKILYLKIGSYAKKFALPQVELMKLLLRHLINEKIEFATSSDITKLSNDIIPKSPSTIKETIEKDQMDTLIVKETVIRENDTQKEKIAIIGTIKAETEKALLILFDTDKEAWVPKSTIHKSYQKEAGLNQSFLIEKWILKRNKIIE